MNKIEGTNKADHVNEDSFDCPLIEKVSGGEDSKVHWFTCYHEMNSAKWPISRGNCKEVYSICTTCGKDPMVNEILILPKQFHFETLDDAWDQWENWMSSSFRSR